MAGRTGGEQPGFPLRTEQGGIFGAVGGHVGVSFPLPDCSCRPFVIFYISAELSLLNCCAATCLAEHDAVKGLDRLGRNGTGKYTAAVSA